MEILQLNLADFKNKKVGDFKIDQKLTFEIGGKNKTKEHLSAVRHEIKDLKNAFIAADDIEIGFQEKIPLWLFGFLYRKSVNLTNSSFKKAIFME